MSEPRPSGALTRRQVLVGGAGLALAAGTGLAATGAGRRLLDQVPLVGRLVDGAQPLDRTPMSGRLGERFTTRDARDRRVELILTAIEDLPVAGSGADSSATGAAGQRSASRQEGQFVARFEGPAQHPLEQNTYRFDTDHFGAVDVFVVPGPAGSGTLSYSAVFNRIPTEVQR